MDSINRKIYISNSFDPAVNLSYEEYLMSICEKNDIIFYLWQNKNTVVIGRNQNPIKECQIEALKEDDVNLVRRLSGGGAVYHDLGNLNFTFIAHDSIYNVKRQLEVILDSIKKFGILGEFTGRNDLTVDGKKFSGNAFMDEDGVCCHHGTLLVNVTLQKLARYLTPSKIKVTSKGIESVRSRVVNLSEFNKDVTVHSLKNSLIESFNKIYSLDSENTEPIIFDDEKIIINYRDKYNKWEWNMKESPKCTINNTKKFSWGTFDIDFDIEDGVITKCYINTDSIIVDNFELLCKNLSGAEARMSTVNEIIDNTIKDVKVRENIKESFTETLN
ncbi:lipoate--protein ligase [Mycoplasmatota bacterium WC44]